MTAQIVASRRVKPRREACLAPAWIRRNRSEFWGGHGGPPLLDDDLDAAVVGSAFGCLVVGDGVCFAFALGEMRSGLTPCMTRYSRTVSARA